MMNKDNNNSSPLKELIKSEDFTRLGTAGEEINVEWDTMSGTEQELPEKYKLYRSVLKEEIVAGLEIELLDTQSLQWFPYTLSERDIEEFLGMVNQQQMLAITRIPLIR